MGEHRVSEFRAVVSGTARSLRDSWQALTIASVVYKIAALLLLTPVVGLLFQLLLAVSGKTVLADQDILLFLLEPLGWICFIAVGALSIGIVALEQAALLGILRPDPSGRSNWMGGLQLASVNAWRGRPGHRAADRDHTDSTPAVRHRCGLGVLAAAQRVRHQFLPAGEAAPPSGPHSESAPHSA